MKRHIRHILPLLLASLILSACGGQTVQDTNTSAEISADTTEAESYLPPEGDFGGAVFTIYGQSTDVRQNFWIEEVEGEVCNDAIHSRDLAVEERLNITLEYLAESDREVVTSTARSSILAGDEEYHLLINALSAGINHFTTAGVLYDLRQIPHLTLDSQYWNKSMYDRMHFNGAQYFTTGPISYQYFMSPIVVRFNKRLTEEYQMGDIYGLVLDGKWTVDKLAELSKDKAIDLDNNGKMDINDFYGLALEGIIGTAFYTAAGFDTVSRENGNYSVTIGSAASVDLIQKYAAFFADRNQYIFDDHSAQNLSNNLFSEGRAIFHPFTMLDTVTLRDMKDDFGIVPMPKYTEEQEKYHTACNTWYPTGVAVPLTCSDPERTGTVMENLAYYSYEIMTPAVYEITLQGKVSRDDVSSRMLDIIYEELTFDFISTFNFVESERVLRSSVLGETENFVSKWASIEAQVQAELDAVISIADER
ncbi:MAG: hypothetical protein E7632_03425 [Ruminococcaceae bacterium]|nr:hypothetical protein [Oscillospiraceae bacterium]